MLDSEVSQLHPIMPRRILLVRLALTLCGVALITYICGSLLLVNASTAGFAYLILVLTVATVWGLAEALAASVAAMLCYNFFFFPPVGRLTIADPENWVAVFAFLATALVASHLSDRARKQAQEAKRRQQETEQLYALSRAILLTDTSQPIGAQAAQHIAQVFDLPSVALYDSQSGTTYNGGREELGGVEDGLKQVVLQGGQHHQSGIDIWPIALGGRPIGALAARENRLSDGAMQALLNLVAISLERVRTEEAAKRAEVARQSEEFKSTLLDAIAHEFKTPLTSIKAASTSLLANRERLGAGQQEMAAVIDEETDRLSLLVTEAVRMSQIDAGKVRLERSTVTVENVVEAAASSFGSRAEGRILISRPAAAGALLSVDVDMVILALRQLMDNALKYSAPPSAVMVRPEVEDDRVVIRVIDQGPGVPERERDHIFDKFYRPNVRNQVPGSGLGLHIAREIARTHGGDLWLEPGKPDGTEFCLALPRVGETTEAQEGAA